MLSQLTPLFYIVSSLIAIVSSRSVVTPNVCKLGPEPGPCDALFYRYHFNGETGNCEQFVYGGCQGNGNNFMTIEDCQSWCSPTSQLLKRLTREVSQFQPASFNETTQQSPNETTSVITTTLQPQPIVTTSNPNIIETEAPTPPKTREDVCFQPFAEGNCKENLIRYYYDPEVNKCKKFIFKGCFQYDNNFEKLEDCESLCVLPTSTPTPKR